MKLLLTVLFLPVFSFAQKAPNQTNTIYLTGISKEAVKTELIKQGFTVVDHDSLSFVTLPRQYKVIENGSIILKVVQKDSSRIELTGSYNQVSNDTLLNPYGNKWKPIVKTVLFSNARGAFGIMNTFAHSLPGQVTYGRR